MTSEALSKEQFRGLLPIKAIKPTERMPGREGREEGPHAQAYQRDLVEHMREHGFEHVGPLEIDYGRRFRSSRKPFFHLMQGHHRLQAAKTLRLTHVPVVVDSWSGRPPGLEDHE